VIVAFGDSLTAGFGADPGKSYPDFLQQELDRRGLRYRVANAGISGETTTDALERLSTVTALRPAVVIVEFGGNDGLRGLPVSTTRSNLDQIVAGLKEAGAQVLLAGHDAAAELRPGLHLPRFSAFTAIWRRSIRWH
jgi:acyl-CoA thioesterase I